MKEYGVNSIKVRDLLMEMRKFRMGLIQTHDQLRFSYLAIIKGASDTSWESNSQASHILLVVEIIFCTLDFFCR